jgi:hypothetical protein
VFAQLLEADGDTGAYAREIALQGKYATEEEKAKVKKPLVTKPAKDEPKTEDPDKGVTTSDKPADETAGTPPPAPAVEVKASESSLVTRLTSLSIPTGIVTAIGAIFAIAKEVPPYAWIAFALIIVAAMVIGYLVYRDSKREAHERTKIVLAAAADRDKNNLRLV